MRLILTAAVVTTLSPTTAPARMVDDIPVTAMPNPGALPAKCVKRDRLRVKGRDQATQRKLGDMPPADQIKAVYRSKDGCPDPLVVRYGVGVPKPARPGG
jgi:hypothetical protein